MIISVLTSSHLRHKYLVSKLSDNFKKVLYINEKKPSIRVKRISIVKNYFCSKLDSNSYYFFIFSCS